MAQVGQCCSPAFQCCCQFLRRGVTKSMAWTHCQEHQISSAATPLPHRSWWRCSLFGRQMSNLPLMATTLPHFSIFFLQHFEVRGTQKYLKIDSDEMSSLAESGPRRIYTTTRTIPLRQCIAFGLCLFRVVVKHPMGHSSFFAHTLNQQLWMAAS